jgi:hypothetical protein
VQPQFYRPSGRVSLLGLFVAWIVGGVVASAGALVYAAVLVYNPSAYLGVFLPMAFGAAIGGMTAAAGKRFKIRNPIVLTVFATMLTMGGYLISWPPWMWLTLSRLEQPIDFVAVIFPPTFVDILGLMYENGVWTIGTSSSGGAVSGVALGIVWLCEAVLIFGAAALTAYTVGAMGVFCETCEEWCVRTKELLRHVGSSTTQLTHELSNRDLKSLERTPRAHPGSNEWVESDLYACRCGATNTIDVFGCTRTFDRRGQPRVQRISLVKHLLITKQEADWTRALAGR